MPGWKHYVSGGPFSTICPSQTRMSFEIKKKTTSKNLSNQYGAACTGSNQSVHHQGPEVSQSSSTSHNGVQPFSSGESSVLVQKDWWRSSD